MIGSGERIRTTDLRVMSPTSYHCSTPRYRWRTDLVSHKATLQYLQRWSVSRPGSGWNGVGPLHFMHAIARTAVCPITSTKSIPRLPYFTDSEHNASFEHGSLDGTSKGNCTDALPCVYTSNTSAYFVSLYCFACSTTYAVCRLQSHRICRVW